MMLKMPFTDIQKGIIVTEGDTKRSFRLGSVTLNNDKNIEAVMNPEGGFVMRFDPSETIRPENE